MKGKRVLKRISACAVACASFTLVACEQGLPSGGSTGSGNGKFDMDEITLDAVYALLESYGVIEDIEDLETLFDEDNAKGYEYLIVEEKGIILVKDNGKKTTYGELGECKHSKFGIPKEEVEGDCETLGVETSVCKNCSAVRYEFDIPSGHEWELIEEIPATKTERGKKIYECEECRESKTERTPKLENDDSGNEDTGNEDTGDGGVTIDPSRTIFYVAAANAGDGRFLDALAEHFEEAYQNTSFEAGKMGVDVIVEYRTDLNGNIHAQLPYMESEVLFIPSTASTDSLVMSGLVADLTDIVCEEDKNTGVCIEDVMSQADKEEFRYIDGKYYAIPYIRDSWGLIYNAGLFEEYNYEVPNTTEEMFMLCEEMKHSGVTPLITTGAYPMYLDELVKIWWAQYEGVQNYTNFWNGVDENGLYSASIFAQQGRLTSWEILEKIYESDYLHRDSMDMANSHLDAQARFLMSSLRQEPIAMITEGSWMLTESEDILREFEAITGDAYLDIRMMKTPVNSAIINKCPSIPDDETLSAVITAIDEGYEYYDGVTDEDFAIIYEARNLVSTTGYNAIINENVQGYKEAVAKKFLQFVASEEGVNTLANTTGAKTAFTWAITENAYFSMDSVRRSAFDILCEGIALPDENKLTMLKFGVPVDRIYCNGTQYPYIAQAFQRGDYTASEIFALTRDWFNGNFMNMLVQYGVTDA